MNDGTLNAVRYRASGAILNPWYIYPISISFGHGQPYTEKAPEISIPCSMPIPELGLLVVLTPRDLTFTTTDASRRDFGRVESVRQYLMYRTFLNFNHEFIDSAPDPPPRHADPLRFDVRRLVRHETTVDGRVAVHHTDVAETILVASAEIHQFLNALDRPLAQALGFYLRADSARYVLVDYYKAFESISDALGGVAALVSALGRHGVTEKDRRDFTGLCNDTMRDPTDIGRHAPRSGAAVRVIDERDPFGDQRFVENLEVATRFCRQVIDAYVLHRTQNR